MAKVKLIGDVQLEFEVKYGLEGDLVITVYSVSADGVFQRKRVLWELIGLGSFNPLKEVSAEALKRAMYQSEVGTLIMLGCQAFV